LKQQHKTQENLKRINKRFPDQFKIMFQPRTQT